MDRADLEALKRVGSEADQLHRRVRDGHPDHCDTAFTEANCI